MNRKLSVKIAIYVGLLVLFVSAGMGVTASIFSSNIVRSQAEASLQQLSDLGANEVDILVQARIDLLSEIAKREIITTMHWSSIRNSLRSDVEKLGYMDMALVTPDGQARYVVSGDIAELGDRSYVQKAFAGEANISDVLISRVTNQAVLMYAAPIEFGGKVVGVLIARRDGNALAAITDKMGFGEEGYAYVVNTNGVTVAHPNRDNVMEQINLVEKAKEDPNFESVGAMMEKVLVENRGVGEYDYNGKHMYSAYAPIPGTHWILINVAESAEVLSQVNTMSILIFGITAIFIAIGIISSFILGRSIARPIQDLSKEILKISDYDLTLTEMAYGEKYVKKKDEVGIIAKAIRTMQSNLVLLIKDISRDAESVASSSEQLTATSEQSASAAEEVAKTIEEIANGASDQAQETTSGATEIDALARIIGHELELVEVLNHSAETVNKLKDEGFIVLKDLEQKTAENNQASKNVHSMIIETNESAERIEKASDMIKNIADQTNLLALNAAIEAARAGEAGRGFSVVADEIRKLAEQSNVFASEISSIIVELGSKTNQAVKTMESANVIVTSQLNSLKNTHTKFTGIADAIEDVKRVVSDLNASSATMIEKKNQITSIIENLSAISQENAAGTEEASASVEEQTAAMAQIADASMELAKLAEAMQRRISKFSI